jgi:hypothetical protein
LSSSKAITEFFAKIQLIIHLTSCLLLLQLYSSSNVKCN